MKQFFKYMFASTLGTILGFVLIFILSGMILAGIIGSAVMMAESQVKMLKSQKNSILVVDISERLVERKTRSPFEGLKSKDLMIIAESRFVNLWQLLKLPNQMSASKAFI